MKKKTKELPNFCEECQNKIADCVCASFDAACDKETLMTLKQMDALLMTGDVKTAHGLLRTVIRAFDR